MGYDLRPMSASSQDPVLLALREEIAAADRDLLSAFTRRLQVAAKIRAHKADCGYDFVDLERETRSRFEVCPARADERQISAELDCGRVGVWLMVDTTR